MLPGVFFFISLSVPLAAMIFSNRRASSVLSLVSVVGFLDGVSSLSLPQDTNARGSMAASAITKYFFIVLLVLIVNKYR